MIYSFDDLSFQVLTVDRFFHRQGRIEVKARPYAALSFRVRGTGTFEVGGRRLTTNPGDVLFLPADMPYTVTYSESESIVSHLTRCNYDKPENSCFVNGSAIDVRFRYLLESWQKQHSGNQAKSVIYDILERMAKDKKMSISSTAADCMRYMDVHFADPELDIEGLCRLSYISVSSLQRAFYSCLGMSPKQYLIRLRMNQALQLLSDNELSVREIASACGFADEKYFSRAFRKKYGCPPSQLRKHVTE